MLFFDFDSCVCVWVGGVWVDERFCERSSGNQQVHVAVSLVLTMSDNSPDACAWSIVSAMNVVHMRFEYVEKVCDVFIRKKREVGK